MDTCKLSFFVFFSITSLLIFSTANVTRNTTKAGSTRSWSDVLVKTPPLSPCYGAINYHILEKTQGRLEVTEKETVQFSLGLNETSPNNCSLIWVRIVVEPVAVKTAALVDSHNDIFTSKQIVESRIISLRRGDRFPTRLYVRGVFLGYSTLNFQALPNNNDNIDTKAPDFNVSQIADSQWFTFRSGKIATFREHRPLDAIFKAFVICLIVCGNIGIGLNINWKEIREVIKRPIGPVIGFCCQYIVMPLAGFTVVKLIDLQPNVALGIFLIGCAPGGGGSNYHTYFLGGSLPLSVTMTFLSTVAGIGMMPFWVFTLGSLVVDEAHSGINIDFKGIIGALFTSITPFLIGIFIHWRRPTLAVRIFRVFVRPLLVFIFLYLITVGLFTNLYLFTLLRPNVLLAGIMLPYAGFTIGFVVALIAKQSRPIAVTIAIETGIQASAVAFATLFLSLPQPDADIAIVGPLAVAMFTPIPLWIIEIIRGVYLCVKSGRCLIFDSCRERLGKGEDGEASHDALEEKPAKTLPSDIESNKVPSPKSKLLVPGELVVVERDSGLVPLLPPIIESQSSEDASTTAVDSVDTACSSGSQLNTAGSDNDNDNNLLLVPSEDDDSKRQDYLAKRDSNEEAGLIWIDARSVHGSVYFDAES